MNEVPETLPVTEEARERLRAQANQVGEPTVIRLLDLLAVAVDDMRQGADPRLPLELALVKVTRPAADLSRESIGYRLEQLESRGATTVQPTVVETPKAPPTPQASAPDLELEQLQEAWARTIVPAVAEKSIPTSSLFGEARPADLANDTLTIEFPRSADFHRKLAEDPKNATLLRDALYEVTGRRLAVAFAIGDEEEAADDEEPSDEPIGEEKFMELLKETFDARERETE
jgi:DNA polymerase III gamma/tau subunit